MTGSQTKSFTHTTAAVFDFPPLFSVVTWVVFFCLLTPSECDFNPTTRGQHGDRVEETTTTTTIKVSDWNARVSGLEAMSQHTTGQRGVKPTTSQLEKKRKERERDGPDPPERLTATLYKATPPLQRSSALKPPIAPRPKHFSRSFFFVSTNWIPFFLCSTWRLHISSSKRDHPYTRDKDWHFGTGNRHGRPESCGQQKETRQTKFFCREPPSPFRRSSVCVCV